MAWPKEMPVVQVFWSDSAHTEGWNLAEILDPIVARGADECVSVGFLYEDSPAQVALLMSVARGGSLANLLQIPRHAIHHVRTLDAPE